MLSTIAFCLLTHAAWTKLPVESRHPLGSTLVRMPHFGHCNRDFRVARRLSEPEEANKRPSADDVRKGLRDFYQKTARPDGSFQPGIDPAYRGLSDAAYSDLAAVTYAVVVHKTFGWKLPYEQKTAEFLLSRQKPSGEFFNVAGTVSPVSPEGRTYNTTQGLVALHALGLKPKHDPLPVFEAILKEDYKGLPAYATSFFPLAYRCLGRPVPEQADRGLRALMVQDETGYTNDHVAATFHASHYYRLVGEATPRSREMVARVLRDQKPNGSWLLNMPARDRHATFDALFILVQEGGDSPECRAAIRRAAAWVLTCRNRDGGFGHYPGSPSDADAIYFHVGALVMAGVLKPSAPLPPDPELLSWGHLMPVLKRRPSAPRLTLHVPGWVAGVAIDHDRLAVASSDSRARLFDVKSGRELLTLKGHEDAVAAVQVMGSVVATGSYDHTAALWDAASGKLLHRLTGHRGPVMAVAFSPDKRTLATSSLDGTIKLWNLADGREKATLTGHKAWVNALAYDPEGGWLASGSSDGTIRIWSAKTNQTLKTVAATNAEVRSIAISPDGVRLAAGLRYGAVKTWDTATWKQELDLPGQGDMCAVAFASPQRLMSSLGDWNRGGVVRVHNTASGEQIAHIRHTGEIISLAVSGETLAAGAADRTVRVWTTQE
jgi:geranylgeranyl transferase type-2 subunit beta